MNFSSVLSESKRIILSRYNHFLTLSLLFLPLSFSLITSPTLRHHLSNEPFTEDHSNHKKHVIYYLLYTLLVNVLALYAIGMVIYSTHHAFFDKPVKILDALKSLLFSFFRLALTAIVVYILIVLISLSFILLVGTVVMLLHNIGFVIDYNSVYFLAIMGAILIAILIYFQVNWSLVSVVVVVESKWGFAALMRSSYLVKGMRSVSLLLKVYFGVGVLIVGTCFANIHVIGVAMLGSIFITMLLLWITTANTVLYNHCKALHGELAFDADEGFGLDCMDLPLDGEKVPRVVIVVAT